MIWNFKSYTLTITYYPSFLLVLLRDFADPERDRRLSVNTRQSADGRGHYQLIKEMDFWPLMQTAREKKEIKMLQRGPTLMNSVIKEGYKVPYLSSQDSVV